MIFDMLIWLHIFKSLDKYLLICNIAFLLIYHEKVLFTRHKCLCHPVPVIFELTSFPEYISL